MLYNPNKNKFAFNKKIYNPNKNKFAFNKKIYNSNKNISVNRQRYLSKVREYKKKLRKEKLKILKQQQINEDREEYIQKCKKKNFFRFIGRKQKKLVKSYKEKKFNYKFFQLQRKYQNKNKKIFIKKKSGFNFRKPLFLKQQKKKIFFSNFKFFNFFIKKGNKHLTENYEKQHQRYFKKNKKHYLNIIINKYNILKPFLSIKLLKIKKYRKKIIKRRIIKLKTKYQSGFILKFFKSIFQHKRKRKNIKLSSKQNKKIHNKQIIEFLKLPNNYLKIFKKAYYKDLFTIGTKFIFRKIKKRRRRGFRHHIYYKNKYFYKDEVYNDLKLVILRELYFHKRQKKRIRIYEKYLKRNLLKRCHTKYFNIKRKIILKKDLNHFAKKYKLTKLRKKLRIKKIFLEKRKLSKQKRIIEKKKIILKKQGRKILNYKIKRFKNLEKVRIYTEACIKLRNRLKSYMKTLKKIW